MRWARVNALGALVVAGVLSVAGPAFVASSPLPELRRSETKGGDLLIHTSLNFVVSICLDDTQYSFACRQRGLLEAARRLEQLYFDCYTKKVVAGSLKIWFARPVERGQQLEFLRTVEERAIAAVTARVQGNIDQIDTSSGAGAPDSLAQSSVAQRNAQRSRMWHDTAIAEARAGSNWVHYWAERAHQSRESPALHLLARINATTLP